MFTTSPQPNPEMMMNLPPSFTSERHFTAIRSSVET